jgi:hypothetical protein
MTSITVPTGVNSNNIDTEEKQEITRNSFPMDKCRYVYQWATANQTTKTGRALSYNEERIQSPVASSSSSSTATTTTSHNNRFKHLCTRLKRRFSITKDYRTRSKDMNRGLSVRFGNYKTFSSSIDDTNTEYDWPDFEKVYDSIPHCLVRTLPGLDDISIEDDNDGNTIDTTKFLTDENDELAHLFECCTRGKHFRRNAICRKLDKTQYRGQLDTFIQQLMIEKLMRTWT